MRELSMSAAIRESLQQLLRAHPEAYLIGEDIGVYGGAFKISAGFVSEFGDDRVVDTPISEAGIVSVAAGSALCGSRPIVEIMFMDFLPLALDGLINVAVKWRDIYGDAFGVPLIIRAPAGGGRSYGPTHSQSFEGLLMNVPKLVICCPSSPADAAGLLLGAYDAATTVVFVEHKVLYARKGPVPATFAPLPIGEAAVLRPGTDLTIVSYGRHVASALAAAEALVADGVSAEVVDLRTIKPLDRACIVDSIQRTGRLLTVEESPVIGGVGGELAALAMTEAFDYLEAPLRRLGAAEEPIPCSPALEQACFPTADTVAAAARELVAY
jgi:pyruvate/2-oxoglutarate/acetoin dehydrogenase E1 component